MVLRCLSLMISDFEHLFMCLLAIWMSSLKKNVYSVFVCFFLINSHTNGCKVVLIVVWIHIFLMISNIEHLFKCLLAGCLYIFFGEMCIQVLSPVFIQIVHSVVIIGIPCRFWMLISYQIYDLQIFSPILCVAFSFC